MRRGKGKSLGAKVDAEFSISPPILRGRGGGLAGKVIIRSDRPEPTVGSQRRNIKISINLQLPLLTV